MANTLSLHDALPISHSAFGAAAASFLSTDPAMLALAGTLSVIPDMDKPFGHRGWFSHSFFAAGLFALAGFVVSGYSLLLGLVVLIAVSVHILLDFFTLSGVPVLFPFSSNDHGLRVSKSSDVLLNKAFLAVALAILAYNLSTAYDLPRLLSGLPVQLT